ncbi:MAG: hypothetical protein AB4352_19150 [Hormoscilla sp.]
MNRIGIKNIISTDDGDILDNSLGNDEAIAGPLLLLTGDDRLATRGHRCLLVPRIF